MQDSGRGGDAAYREAITPRVPRATPASIPPPPASQVRPRGTRSETPETRFDGWHGGAYAGRFLLGRVVGRGATGEVYAAVDPRTGERAAVKLLQPDAGHHLDTRRRFLRERRIATSLASPHVARTIDVGETRYGVPYLAMELLDGHDLGWLLRRRGRLPLPDVIELVREIAAGLEHAHRAGVVHRDIKPSNVFLARSTRSKEMSACYPCADRSTSARPRWKILDFGAAKLEAATDDVRYGELVGTPGYVSPEAVRGEVVDGRADIFGLGAVAYAALTGRPAFFGSDPARLLDEIAYPAPARPSDVAPGVPVDVELVLALMLAKDRGRRIERAALAGTAFEKAAHGRLDRELRRRARGLFLEEPWRGRGSAEAR